MTQLSDEILIAYGDGELGAAQICLVDKVFATDHATHEQFQRLQSTGRRLSQAFSSMLQAEAKQVAIDHASNAPVRAEKPVEAPRQAPRQVILMPAMAAGIVLVSLGAVGGYLASNSVGSGGPGEDPFANSFWNNERVSTEQVRSKALTKDLMEPKTTAATSRRKAGSPEKWYESVAARHKSDAARLLDQYTGKSRNYELALFQFTDTQISPSLIPILRDEGMTFVGASPVQIKGQKYARLAYRDKSNGAVPVGLYVGNQSGGSLTLERGYRGDENYVRWRQGTRSYMLIGAVPHWRLIVLCASVQSQLVK
ncbi:MAG: hypothetical protein GY927_08375 [bacterium]|nr:hypothetical protein [bacterium]